MASGSDQCYRCKGKSGKRLKCAFCPRHYHMQCLEPPLHKTPRSPWACPVCKKARSKSKPTQRKKPTAEQLLKKEEQQQQKVKVVSNSRVQSSKDMEPCRQLLTEMENHESSWPFLVPVNMKQVPEYYKIIKHPMDFHTMKTKLRDYQYKNKEEFVRDARLVFFNCKTYNEDESEVGRAGATMRAFFDKRWPQVKKNTAPTTPQSSKHSSNNHTPQSYTNNKKAESDSSDDDGDDEAREGDEGAGSSSSSDEISSESESSEVEEDSENEAESKEQPPTDN